VVQKFEEFVSAIWVFDLEHMTKTIFSVPRGHPESTSAYCSFQLPFLRLAGVDRRRDMDPW
jgi:hypothetical protein